MVAVVNGVSVNSGVGVMVGADCVSWAITVCAAAVEISATLRWVGVGVAFSAAGPQAPSTNAPNINTIAILTVVFCIFTFLIENPEQAG